jgi:hypothetical protein
MVSTDLAGRSGRRWVLPVALAVAVVGAVAVGVLARDVYRRPGQVPAAEAVVVSSSGSSSQVPPSSQPGDHVVRLSVDASLHPDGERVQALLQRHFDSINEHSYKAWVQTVTEDRVRKIPESRWSADYESTEDGGIVVQRIEASSSERLRAMMTFVSVQDVAKAPAELPERCIRWHVVFPIQAEDGTLRVDVGPENAASQFERC